MEEPPVHVGSERGMVSSAEAGGREAEASVVQRTGTAASARCTSLLPTWSRAADFPAVMPAGMVFSVGRDGEKRRPSLACPGLPHPHAAEIRAQFDESIPRSTLHRWMDSGLTTGWRKSEASRQSRPIRRRNALSVAP